MAFGFFSGNYIKLLKAQLNLNDDAYILTGSDNPTSVAKDAPRGSLYLRNSGSTGTAYLKQDNGSSTNWSLVASLDTGITELTSDVTAGPGNGSRISSCWAYHWDYWQSYSTCHSTRVSPLRPAESCPTWRTPPAVPTCGSCLVPCCWRCSHT